MTCNFRADLHCHSTCSDGTDPPERLLELAVEANLQGLSITDHDTTKAYTPELFKLAEDLGIQLITGVEISTEFQDTSVHVLGYGFDLTNQKIQDLLALMQVRRTKRNRGILKKLQDKNMQITEEELNAFASNRSVGRPHIAQIMIQKGYVSSIKDAFELYLKETASCYVPGLKYHPEEAIKAIQGAGGKAVLAHPHFYKKRNFLQALLDLPFDGYECYYSRLAKVYELPWVERAKNKGLIATGGSDYHGEIKPHIQLGCSWVNQDTFEKIRKN